MRLDDSHLMEVDGAKLEPLASITKVETQDSILARLSANLSKDLAHSFPTDTLPSQILSQDEHFQLLLLRVEQQPGTFQMRCKEGCGHGPL